MKITRRIEMTFETEKTVTLRMSNASCEICERCDSKVTMRTVEEAAQLVSASPALIVQLVESRCVHFRRGHAGALLICLDSLLKTTDVDAPASGGGM